MKNKIQELFYAIDDTGSNSWVERLYWRAVDAQVSHVTSNAVCDLLFFRRAYTLHKLTRRHFRRNHIHVCKIDKQWQADPAYIVVFQQDNARKG